jgi:hydrogenase maturation protein HypF
MLPTTPLHILVLRRLDRPVVMTSGNLSDEPQITGDEEALGILGKIAEYALIHDRPIANRLDDSVVRTMGGKARLLRRARGYAPEPIPLPQGFEAAPDLIAMGGELKATFCLVKGGQAVLSPHIGDLESAMALEDYERSLKLHADLFEHRPAAVAVDLHPEYLSAKLGRTRAEAGGLKLVEVQHHHAHIAACMAESGRPLTAPPVLGIALDGLGWGADGAIWGGEFLLADYVHAEWLATFKPVAMPGAAQAIREPWRSLYAHLAAEMSWAELKMNFGELEVVGWLEGKPRAALDAMIRGGEHAPTASSCGRLFDAVAAALGLCRDRQGYEGEAASRLEALVDRAALEGEDETLAYPFTFPRIGGTGIPYVEPLAMWNALLGDLVLGTPPGVIAARFHRGLAKALAAMVVRLADKGFDTVALSGGCFQNKVLFEQAETRLRAEGFTVLTHAAVPANDGGLALGQAAVAAARLITGRTG